MYQRHLEALTSFASGERFREDLLAAKLHYFARTGEVFEDDRSFEPRMAGFLDFFLFDWPVEGRTPAEHFLAQAQAVGAEPEELQIIRGLTETRHSLWEVRRLGKEEIRLRDVFTQKDTEVWERRQPVGLRKGDLIEARLIPVAGRYRFSAAFCFHPEEAKKNVLKELKRLKKEEPTFSAREFIWRLSNMRLKFERYRNIAPRDIYVFGPKKAA